MRIEAKRQGSYVDVTLCSRKLRLKIGIDILDWGWLFRRSAINFGPFGVWWLTGKAAADTYVLRGI
ncbi:hypothetical protein LCGC14_0329650 [marine sediment metagenome]|uniref:Uncharacterized protein n=1 Tax=marine sediment metagenome TaxID=412755 RepID=A0A0F9TZF2_9ZZZZ